MTNYDNCRLLGASSSYPATQRDQFQGGQAGAKYLSSQGELETKYSHHLASQAESKYGQAESKYGQADTKYGQTESKYGQTESKYGQSESKYGQQTEKQQQQQQQQQYLGQLAAAASGTMMCRPVH